MEIVTSIAQSMGAAWAGGINLYATCAVLGLLGRFDVVELRGGMAAVESWWIIGPALALYCVEFIADKIPLVDSAWDAIHTFVRVPAGALLAASTFSGDSMATQVAALMSGGAIAAETHTLKASTRAAVNMSPEPMTNWVVSIAEDIGVVSVILFAVQRPGWFLVVLIVLLLTGAVALWFLRRFVRAMVARTTAMFGR